MVLRLDANCDYDPAEFTRHGIAHADLRDTPAPGAADAGEWRLSLGELDRFMRHMDSVPGLIALHFARDDAHARALVGTYIARRMRGAAAPASPASPSRRRRGAPPPPAAAEGFEAREAVAWLHIAHPYPGGGWQRVAGDVDSDQESEPDPAAGPAEAAAAAAADGAQADAGKMADSQSEPASAVLMARA
jgi:hypothetical protein